MATFNNGYMGAFNGKLGPAVAYTWKGRQCLRAYLPKKKDPRTAGQLRSRLILSTTSRLASGMQYAAGIGLRGSAAERGTSVHNVFVSLNRHCVGVAEGEPTIDYTALRVADGDLAGVAFGEPEESGEGEMAVTFASTGGGGCGGDYVYLFAYVPSLECGRLSLPAARRGGRVALTLPSGWAGRTAHLYGFVWDCDLRCSPSQYLGTTRLTSSC